MARPHGDLSADVLDVEADWTAGGLTRQAYDFALPALVGGLSSRWVLGETGPMHMVGDPLTLDRALVPLWRKIAAAADAAAAEAEVAGPADRHGSGQPPQAGGGDGWQANPWR